MSRRRRFAAVVSCAGALIVMGGTAGAHAKVAAATSTENDRPFVVLTGELRIPAGERYTNAIIFHGDLVIEGDVAQNAIAFNGDVVVSGHVGGNVTALNGVVIVQRSGSVDGDVISSDPPDVAPGTVAGSISQGTRLDVKWPALFGRVFWWFATTGSVFVLGLLLTLLLPRAADALAATALGRVGPTIGWGVAGFLGLPVLGFLATITVIAGLAGIGLLLSLMLIYTVAYTVGAYALGRALVKEPRGRFLAFLAGFGILRVAALVPVLGGLAFVVIAGWGIGAMIVATFRAGRGAAGTPSLGGSVAIPPMPPMPGVH